MGVMSVSPLTELEVAAFATRGLIWGFDGHVLCRAATGYPVPAIQIYCRNGIVFLSGLGADDEHEKIGAASDVSFEDVRTLATRRILDGAGAEWINKEN